MNAAEEILNEYRDRFILEMGASSIALDLFHHSINSRYCYLQSRNGYIERDKLDAGTLSKIITELVAIRLTRVISYP